MAGVDNRNGFCRGQRAEGVAAFLFHLDRIGLKADVEQAFQAVHATRSGDLAAIRRALAALDDRNLRLLNALLDPSAPPPPEPKAPTGRRFRRKDTSGP
ncbi:hypothetical protein ACFVVU_01495 [Kitasatospora sp. NPDC057965]|uniref:hypothetical protein n=1 Tax=Kitasatospora sp. NPDC057965 TaxID=3346291 RepID=UPI0036DD8423